MIFQLVAILTVIRFKSREIIQGEVGVWSGGDTWKSYARLFDLLANTCV